MKSFTRGKKRSEGKNREMGERIKRDDQRTKTQFHQLVEPHGINSNRWEG
jgi:hypothetical protein